MKLLQTALVSSFLISGVAFADELTIYTKTFQLENADQIVKCFKSDPNSRAYGRSFLSVNGSEVLEQNTPALADAKFVTNTYNGVFGDTGGRSCDNLPALTEKDGNLRQSITLTAIAGFTGYCSLIYREGIYLSMYGQELYGYDHGEIVPPTKENCDLGSVQKIIAGSRSSAPAVLYKDKQMVVSVETTEADADGLCQKFVVTKSKKSGKTTKKMIMPPSTAACGA